MPLPNITIWSFNLSELKFSSFSHKKLFDPRYHLRRQRIIIYQLAMMICLAAECTATYSLSKYEDLQEHIEDNYPGAHLYNNDIIDAQIVSIVFCVLVACVFGAEFFFLAQYPTHSYPRWYRSSMIGGAVVVCLGVFAGAMSSTIIVARNSAKLGGIPEAVQRDALALYYRPPLRYRDWPTNIAFPCLLWVGLVFCIYSTILMYKAAAWDAIHGAQPRELSSDETLIERGHAAPLTTKEDQSGTVLPTTKAETTAPSSATASERTVPL